MAFIYEYRCVDPECGVVFDSTVHGKYLQCKSCLGQAKRRYTLFNASKIQIEPVYNPSLGRHVKSARDFEDGLKQASEHSSEILGRTVSYSSVDPRETKSLGVTSEGLVRSEQKAIYDKVAK